MRIIQAKNAGFCFGVKRAMKLASEAAADNGDQLQRVMVFGGVVFVVGIPLLFAGIWLVVYSLWKKE